MSGAAGRRKGHQWEIELAHWFTGHGHGHVVTTRSLSGGTTAGTDLATRQPDGTVTYNVAGWAIEAKHRTTPAVTGWLRQAADDADGKPYTVVHKNPHHPTGEAWCYLPSVWAEPLLGIELPGDVTRITIDLHTFTAALHRQSTP